jgi:hypothetical protein
MEVLAFPHNTNILWDRTGVTAPSYVSLPSKLSCLVFSKEDVRNILRAVMFDSVSQFGLTTNIVHKNVINRGNQLNKFALHSLMQTPSHCFVCVDSMSDPSDCSVSIPVKPSDIFREEIADNSSKL